MPEYIYTHGDDAAIYISCSLYAHIPLKFDPVSLSCEFHSVAASSSSRTRTAADSEVSMLNGFPPYPLSLL